MQSSLRSWIDSNKTIEEISQTLPNEIVKWLSQKQSNYKHIAVCIITKKGQELPKIESASMWDSVTDYYYSIAQDNENYFFVLNVYSSLFTKA